MEWESGTIPGSLRVHLGDLPAAPGSLPRDKEVWTACASGHRAPLAASLLDRAGVPVRLVAQGGGVVVEATSTNALVLLSVSDSGIGVPLGDQERIFEAGVRLDAERPGSGLGLAITRAIAEAHGGQLTLRSIPGEGATFTIVIPVS